WDPGIVICCVFVRVMNFHKGRKILFSPPISILTILSLVGFNPKGALRSRSPDAWRGRLLMAYRRLLKQVLCGLVLLIGLPLLAQDKFVLVTSPSKVQRVCGRHGLTEITQLSSRGVVLVSAFSPDPAIATDSDVQSFEPDRALALPELSGATIASLT